MNLNDLHSILFNAYILYAVILGVWSAITAARAESISGNFWGAVATSAALASIVTLIGVIMTLQGLRPPRIVVYYLYMAFLIVILPGLFTMLRGRDDRSAAIAFSILAFFNAATALSMWQRDILGPWAAPAV
ncbi:MAG: hypothetical protein BroJett033_5930 [Chloroflexota bacterium]|nr:MAG: hypothetical protein BroJett033_5930 [Chloroflexota bacterium]